MIYNDSVDTLEEQIILSDTVIEDKHDEVHNTTEYNTFIYYNAEEQQCSVYNFLHKPNYIPLLTYTAQCD